MTQLNLQRPLAVLDLETTGVNVGRDRIIEIGILKISPDNTQKEYNKRINPTIPIPTESSEIHHISDEDVKDCPTFEDLAPEINTFLDSCDLAGFNSTNFDIPLLVEEFLRTNIEFKIEGRKLIDVQRIFHTMEPRNLTAALKFYCGKDLEDAHAAMADTKATYEVLLGQLKKYEDNLQNDVNFLHEFTKGLDKVDFAGRMVYNEKGKEVFNFGKHKGKLVEEVLSAEPQYYDWIQKSDFALDTKRKLTGIHLKNFNNTKNSNNKTKG